MSADANAALAAGGISLMFFVLTGAAIFESDARGMLVGVLVWVALTSWRIFDYFMSKT